MNNIPVLIMSIIGHLQLSKYEMAIASLPDSTIFVNYRRDDLLSPAIIEFDMYYHLYHMIASSQACPSSTVSTYNSSNGGDIETRIMVIDDSAVIRKTIEKVLTKNGYIVITASDGVDALSLLSSMRIHLFLSDINMPSMGGYDLLIKLKSLPRYRYTPVCMLTTEGELSKVQECMQAGAKTTLIKPFKSAELVSLVNRLIPR